MSGFVIIQSRRDRCEFHDVRKHYLDAIAGIDCKSSKVRDYQDKIQGRISFRNNGDGSEITDSLREFYFDFGFIYLYFLRNRVDYGIEV